MVAGTAILTPHHPHALEASISACHTNTISSETLFSSKQQTGSPLSCISRMKQGTLEFLLSDKIDAYNMYKHRIDGEESP